MLLLVKEENLKHELKFALGGHWLFSDKFKDFWPMRSDTYHRYASHCTDTDTVVPTFNTHGQ